jgi:hypothetical protein
MVISTIFTIICKALVTRRNVRICSHPICDYMRPCVIYDYFCNYLPTSPNWGRFATILWVMCNSYFFHPSMWMVLGLYSFLNEPPWPISCMCNQNLVTNWCTMYIMGLINIHIWGCTIKKFTYIIINISMNIINIFLGFNVKFLWNYIKGN